MPGEIEQLEASIARQLTLAARIGRIQALAALLDALRGNPTTNVLDLLVGALAFEKMASDAEAERRDRVD